MTPAFDSQLAGKVQTSGIVAVLIIDQVEDAVPLARALLDGGISSMELTLRTPAAMDALKAVLREVPEMLAGVGTVLTPAQVTEVKEAGAAFAVSPGTNPRVLAAAREAGLSFAPGIATPTDIETALEFGCRLLKFFPAESSGGLRFLQSAAAPYAHFDLRYIPLGGINAQNLASYAGDPLVAAVGGSWLAPKEKIAARDWQGITAVAAEAVEIIRKARITTDD